MKRKKHNYKKKGKKPGLHVIVKTLLPGKVGIPRGVGITADNDLRAQRDRECNPVRYV